MKTDGSTKFTVLKNAAVKKQSEIFRQISRPLIKFV